jgi:acyl carrier protein
LIEKVIVSADEIVVGLEEAIAADHPPRDLRLTDKIRENLRLDSLSLLELLARVEERFGIELVDRQELYTSVSTVGELVAVIQNVLASRKAEP